MRTPLAKLIALDEDALFDALIWIDWRSFESEVVESFSAELAAEDALTMSDEEDPREIVYRGVSYAIPLTVSGRDRYVMIASLAEILKDRYRVYVHSDSYGGSDTHGFLLLTTAEAEDAEHQHRKWLHDTFEPLDQEIDGFSGEAIPYYGHELPESAAKPTTEKKPFWKFW
ncbi:hypothetical protein [Lysobacter silvisoli]|uniref:Uncharacterized protein n=1 Tax=Lysobacter silvisoli TaxID=2293254 RepID=A0A371K6R1_9GAMM|nr:hypothetical protein [Lysobacter silvisoli]RDZ29544.1 hypothetical protein DX914_10850 [Lysobacter silvisoli]